MAGERQYLPVHILPKITSEAGGEPAGKVGHEDRADHRDEREEQHAASGTQKIVGLHFPKIDVLRLILGGDILDRSLRDDTLGVFLQHLVELRRHHADHRFRKRGDVDAFLPGENGRGFGA